jgi:NAD(P)-dependent dehydrogenase (short-subunit alcohol dehydrogenase family)
MDSTPPPISVITATTVITGGNGGIGLGLASGLARRGGSIAIWARNDEKSAAAVELLETLGGRAFAVSCDVADEADVDRAMALTLDHFGRVDCLFANAGIPGGSVRFVELELETWRQVFGVNVEGAFLCLRAAARHMVQRGGPGSLVGVSSIAAQYGAPRQAHYAASKTAMVSLMRSLAVELAPQQIRCNTLSPGWFDTDLIAAGSGFGGRVHDQFRAVTEGRTPVRRWGRQDDLDTIAPFLADPSLSFHTGDVLTVDGGYTIC